MTLPRLGSRHCKKQCLIPQAWKQLPSRTIIADSYSTTTSLGIALLVIISRIPIVAFGIKLQLPWQWIMAMILWIRISCKVCRWRSCQNFSILFSNYAQRESDCDFQRFKLNNVFDVASNCIAPILVDPKLRIGCSNRLVKRDFANVVVKWSFGESRMNPSEYCTRIHGM